MIRLARILGCAEWIALVETSFERERRAFLQALGRFTPTAGWWIAPRRYGPHAARSIAPVHAFELQLRDARARHTRQLQQIGEAFECQFAGPAGRLCLRLVVFDDYDVMALRGLGLHHTNPGDP
jgi:hypothetical protein